MQNEIINKALASYNIVYSNITDIIDTTINNDFRLNVILDKKYILRINNANVINEQRLEEFERLIERYNLIGVNSPHLIKNIDGKFSTIIGDKVCYLSEFLDYPLASSIEYTRNLRIEIIYHLGLIGKRFSNYDLVETKSMWSIIDLSPFDFEVDEKQENLNDLVNVLKELNETRIANELNDFNNKNREKIKEVFDVLPRAVYQGDLNSTNVLINNNHFYGLIDYNMSGTEVNINCFLNETDTGFSKDDLDLYDSKTLLNKMIKEQDELLDVIYKNYKLSEVEKKVLENYRNIIMISQYPNVVEFISALKSNQKPKAILLLKAILERK